MTIKLNTPQIKKQEITGFSITRFINDIENKFIQIDYKELNGDLVVGRNKIKITSEKDIKELYNNLDNIMKDGYNIEEATELLLCGKITDLSKAEIIHNNDLQPENIDEDLELFNPENLN
jgi:hypothetical protein